MIADIFEYSQIIAHSWTLVAFRELFVQNTFLNASHIHVMIVTLYLFDNVLAVNVTVLGFFIVVDLFFKVVELIVEPFDLNNIFSSQWFDFFFLSVSLLSEVTIFFF